MKMGFTRTDLMLWLTVVSLVALPALLISMNQSNAQIEMNTEIPKTVTQIEQDVRIEIIKRQITSSVTAGGGSGYYDVVDPQKLAEYLYSLNK